MAQPGWFQPGVFNTPLFPVGRLWLGKMESCRAAPGRRKRPIPALFAIFQTHPEHLRSCPVARRSGKCIGIVALTWDLALKGAASIGVMLVSEEQGKGYGLEAQGALAEYGFTSLGLVRIHSQFAVNNSANERIYHKLGFIAEDHKAGLANNTLPTKFCYLDKQGWQRSFIKNFPG